MPSTASQITIRVFRSVFPLLAAFPSLLKASQEQFNILVPQMAIAGAQEVNGNLGSDTLWITTSSNIEDGVPDLILSCTQDSRGNDLPIFIASSRPSSLIENPEYLIPRLRAMAQALYDGVSSARVFSVFARASITLAFAELWTKKTGITSEPLPYYSATYARCTKATFRNRQYTIFGDTTYELRLGVENDLDKLADLCYEFALMSVSAAHPFRRHTYLYSVPETL
jgi:hypothetical protein